MLHLSLLLQDVAGAELGHGHHALPALGGAGQVVLARSRRGAARHAAAAPPPGPAPATRRRALLPQSGGQQRLAARGGVVVGERLELGGGQLVPGAGGLLRAHADQPRLALLPHLGQVQPPALPQQVAQPPELLDVELLQPDELVPHGPHHLLPREHARVLQALLGLAVDALAVAVPVVPGPGVGHPDQLLLLGVGLGAVPRQHHLAQPRVRLQPPLLVLLEAVLQRGHGAAAPLPDDPPGPGRLLGLHHGAAVLPAVALQSHVTITTKPTPMSPADLSPGAARRRPGTLVAGVAGVHGVGAGPVGGGLVLQDVLDAELVTLQPLAVTQVQAAQWVCSVLGDTSHVTGSPPVVAEKTIRRQTGSPCRGDPLGGSCLVRHLHARQHAACSETVVIIQQCKVELVTWRKNVDKSHSHLPNFQYRIDWLSEK